MNRILPDRIDNTYPGHPAAFWLLAVLVVMKTAMAIGTIFEGRSMAQSTDRIPLDGFGGGGAEAVVALFAIWGLSQLVFNVFGALALTRYRAMIPLIFVLLVFEHLARWLILLVNPIPRSGESTTGLYLNLVLLVVMIIGLVLSLRSARVNVASS